MLNRRREQKPLECELVAIDQSKVRRLARRIARQEDFDELARTFEILGDPTRAKILYLLSREEICVCDLAALLGMSPPAVSHHLRILRDRHVVAARKDGKMVHYTLADDHIRTLVEEGLGHVRTG